MSIDDLLKAKRERISERWFNLVVNTYPTDAREFFGKQKNRFLNPVGAALSQALDALFDSLVAAKPLDDLAPTLEEFIRIRAVQDLTPAQGVSFVLLAKPAIREALAEDIRTDDLYNELLLLESRIDQLLMWTFDLYVAAREKIYEIRLHELRKQFQLVRQTPTA